MREAQHGPHNAGVAGSSPAPAIAGQRLADSRIVAVEQAVEWLQARVVVDPATGCWLWQRALDRDGYGDASFAGQHWKAHRLAYTALVGPIPAGHVLDHRCRTRRCANPAHVRVVTQRINALENSDAPTALNAAKTNCVRGHALSGENLRIKRYSNGRDGRTCRTCARAAMQTYDAARVPARTAARRVTREAVAGNGGGLR